jgi:hypothetical protein
MTVYVIWPKAIDTAFREFYPTVANGEVIQEAPAETETHYMVGSARLTNHGIMALSSEFGDGVTFPEDFPSEFVSDGSGE